MAARSATAACLTASLVLVAACSFHRNGLGAGVEETDDAGALIGGPGAGEGSSAGKGDASGGVAGSGGANGAAGGSAGTPGPDAAPVSARPDAAEVVVPPAPPVDAASPPALPDTAPPMTPDAATPNVSTPGTIACGANRCVVGKEACCVGAAGAAACMPRDGICALGAARRCDGPEDCDGERVCCARGELVGGYRSTCAKAGECAQLGGAIMCRSGADCPPGGHACAPTSFSGSNVGICQR
jgi:hypothetical protein